MRTQAPLCLHLRYQMEEMDKVLRVDIPKLMALLPSTGETVLQFSDTGSLIARTCGSAVPNKEDEAKESALLNPFAEDLSAVRPRD